MDVHSKIDLGYVKIHKDVLSSIAATAAMEVEGVKQIYNKTGLDIGELIGIRSIKRILVDFGKNDEISIEIPIIVKYGYNIPEIAEHAQENIRSAIEKMLDKTPKEININIRGIEK